MKPPTIRAIVAGVHAGRIKAREVIAVTFLSKMAATLRHRGGFDMSCCSIHNMVTGETAFNLPHAKIGQCERFSVRPAASR